MPHLDSAVGPDVLVGQGLRTPVMRSSFALRAKCQPWPRAAWLLSAGGGPLREGDSGHEVKSGPLGGGVAPTETPQWRKYVTYGL